MAPERFRGEADAPCDVYALGLTLYELLVLLPAFESSDRLRLIERIKNEEPVRPRSVDGRIPRDLETIVLKAIDKDPKRRYATAEAMGEDLRRFLDGEPIQARRIGEVERIIMWAQRNPGVAAFVVSTFVAVLALAAVGFFLVYNSRLNVAYARAEEQRNLARSAYQAEAGARQAADQQRGLAVKAQSQAQQALELANRYLYILRVSQAADAWQAGESERASALLDRCPTEQRGWEWHYLDLQRRWPLWQAETRPRDTSSAHLAFSRDGSQVLCATEKPAVFDTRTGAHLTGEPSPSPSHACAISPDGTRIAFETAYARELEVRDRMTNRVLTRASLAGASSHDVVFSPDGRWIAAVDAIAGPGAMGTLRVFDANTGQTRWAMGIMGIEVVFRPGGEEIAFLDRPGNIHIWDVVRGKERRTLTAHRSDGKPIPLDFGRLAFSPDGRRLVSIHQDGLRIWDPDSGQEHLDFSLSGGGRCVAFSPDGNGIVTGGNDGAVRILEAASGRLIRTFRGHSGPVIALAVSPDGHRIASWEGRGFLKVWDATSHQESLTIAPHERNLATKVVFTPQAPGSQVVSLGAGGTVRHWDATHGTKTIALEPNRGPFGFGEISANGQRAVTLGTDRRLRIWDTASGQELPIPALLLEEGIFFPNTHLGFSPDGSRIAATFDIIPLAARLEVWDPVRGQDVLSLIRQGAGGSVWQLAFSPDNLRIVTTDRTEKPPVVWNLADGRKRLELNNPPRGAATWSLLQIVYSPDGAAIAAATRDGMRVWDATTGQLRFSLPLSDDIPDRETGGANAGPIVVLAFSSDSRWLAWGHSYGIVRISDATTGGASHFAGSRKPDQLPGIQLGRFPSGFRRLVGIGPRVGRGYRPGFGRTPGSLGAGHQPDVQPGREATRVRHQFRRGADLGRLRNRPGMMRLLAEHHHDLPRRGLNIPARGNAPGTDAANRSSPERAVQPTLRAGLGPARGAPSGLAREGMAPVFLGHCPRLTCCGPFGAGNSHGRSEFGGVGREVSE